MKCHIPIYHAQDRRGRAGKVLEEGGRELARRAKNQKEAVAIMRTARSSVMRLQGLANSRLAQARTLKLEARLEDLHIWEMKRIKDTKKGAKTYTYWIASWREGKKIRNVYLGSSHKMSREHAQEMAKALKREALGGGNGP